MFPQPSRGLCISPDNVTKFLTVESFAILQPNKKFWNKKNAMCQNLTFLLPRNR